MKIDDCWAGYEKAALTDTQKAFSWKNRIEATERARRLKKLDNPSSGIFNLILTMAIRQFFCLRFPNRQFECDISGWNMMGYDLQFFQKSAFLE